MIPKADLRELKSIRDTVRSARESKLNLRQRFKVRLGMNPDGSNAEFIASVLGLVILLIAPTIAIVGGIYGVSNQTPNWSEIRTAWANIGLVPFTVGSSAVVTAIAFLCFGGGPNKRLHQISLLYPHRDRTIGRYVTLRSLIATVVLPVASLIQFSIVASLFAEVEFTWISAIVFVILQTGFQLSLVLQCAKKWTPSIQHYLLWGLGPLAILVGFLWSAFGTEQVQRDFSLSGSMWHSLSLHLYPPSWVANLWLCSKKMTLLGILPISAIIIWSMVEGVRSFRLFHSMSPEFPLDRDFAKVPPNEIAPFVTLDEIRESRRPPTTTDSIFRSIDQFDFEFANAGPKQSLKKFFSGVASNADFHGVKGVWRFCYCGLLQLAMGFPLLIGLFYVTRCFSSPTDSEIQLLARLVNLVIFLLPTFLSFSQYLKVDQASLYPVSNATLRKQLLRRIRQYAVWILPFWLGLNIAFCMFYEIAPLAKLRLVIEPLATGLGVTMVYVAACAACTTGTLLGSARNYLMPVINVIVAAMFVFGGFFAFLPLEPVVFDIELYWGDSARFVIQVLWFKALIYLLFAIAIAAILMAFKDHGRFDISCRAGLANSLDRKQVSFEVN